MFERFQSHGPAGLILYRPGHFVSLKYDRLHDAWFYIDSFHNKSLVPVINVSFQQFRDEIEKSATVVVVADFQ